MANHRHPQGRLMANSMTRPIKLLAFALLAMISLPYSAMAADIPLLTWERGREHQVVIAEGDLNRDWQVTLEGNGQGVLRFIGSTKDSKGFVVHSLSIPDDLPVGSYSIVTVEDGQDRKVIAGVRIIEAISRTAASNLFDLTAIVIIFILLTTINSIIRARKYSFIPFQSTQVLPRITDPVFEDDRNFWTRLEAAPYRVRVNWLTSFKPSLLRFLLIREGEMTHRLSRNYYGISPLIGLIAGSIAGIQVNRDNGIAGTTTVLFLVLALLAVIDAFAGVAMTLGFWAVLLFSGNVTSLRDILIAISIGIAWVGPSLYASLLRELIARDFTKENLGRTYAARAIATLGSALIGALTFYFGQILLQSIIYTEAPDLKVNLVHLAVIASALVIRGIADDVLINRSSPQECRDESFFIARVTSPMTALLVASTILIFNYVWTRSLSKSFFVALIFSLPYLFSFIRFNKIEKLQFEKLPRNILIESALLAAITFIIFRQISISPLILEERVQLMLFIAGVAPVLHAFLSTIYASNEDKFSFEGNTEIIKP
jgi:hypothetical protein